MAYFYHMRPFDMTGEIIYPLNQLKTRYPALYERQAAKYQDHPSRQQLMLKIIPKLNCLWNDVVQCAPLHPHLLYRELVARCLRANPATEFFQIEATELAGTPVVVFDDKIDSDMSLPVPEDGVQWLDVATYQELQAVPAATLEWYDLLAAQGDRVYGHFMGVPHVFIHGPVDVSRARRIRWGEPFVED